MLHLTKLRELTLRTPAQPGRPAHLSAASGLVRAGEWLYVIADDELHLGLFPVGGQEPGELVRLFGGALPDARAARKASKPDLEALVLLPASPLFPTGALLALGSASTRRRERAALLPLSAQGTPDGTARALDTSPLATALREALGDVNVEGAIVRGSRLVLLQRANRGGARNALVNVALAAVLDPATGPGPGLEVQDVELGAVHGVPLSFTDAALLPDGSLVFSAVAEDTMSSYADGPCVGAAIGIIGADGGVHHIEHLAQPLKVEGIVGEPHGRSVRLLLVTDADDPAIPGALYAAAFARGGRRAEISHRRR